MSGRATLHRRHSDARRHAARRARPALEGACEDPLDVVRQGARHARRGRGLHRRRHPGRQRRAARSSSDDPILANGVVQYVGQPIFIVVATSHDTARLAARRAEIEYEELPAVLTAQQARAAESATCCRRCKLARGEPRRQDGARRASRARRNAARRTGAVLSGRPDRVRRAEGRRRHARLLLDPAPDRDAARRRARAGRGVAQRAGRMPPHGRRLRRQGIAVGVCSRAARRSPRGSCCARSNCARTATTT